MFARPDRLVQADEVLVRPEAAEPAALASPAVKRDYAKATGAAAADADDGGARAAEPPEGDCPICFEDLGASTDATEQCATCNKHVHAECMREWIQQKQARGDALQCVLCRGAWKDSAGAPLRCATWQYAMPQTTTAYLSAALQIGEDAMTTGGTCEPHPCPINVAS
jgi:Ring finger domain